MHFSSKMMNIRPSATLAMNARVLELKAQGIPVTSLAVGEPNFPTPEHIREAGIQAIRDGFTRYTAVPGIPELREAITEYFHRVYDVTPSPECTIVSNGGKQSLYNLFLALLDPGDEVLIPVPYWVSYPAMVHLCQGIPVYVRATASQNFKVTVEQLEQNRTEKTRILIFNSPSNPSGICYTEAESEAIVRWAVEHNIFIISDEIYDQLVYEPAKPAGLARWWTKYPEHIAIVNGLAKSFAMTGWRVGYTLADPALIRILNQITGQTTANICSIAQKAAVAALTGPYDCVYSMREAFRRRRDIGWQEISSWDGVFCPKPDGAFYLFADISALYSKEFPDAAAVCSMLLEKAGVALVPGDAFGDPACVRFSYAVADDVLMDALHRIRKALYGA